MQNNVPIAEFYGKGEVRRNHLADLSRDSSVAVRSRFLRTLERWVRDMAGEDLYEQEVRLYPYLCNFLVDDAPQLCSQGLCVLISLGEAYLEAHEDEYRERVEYGHAEEVRRDHANQVMNGFGCCNKEACMARALEVRGRGARTSAWRQ